MSAKLPYFWNPGHYEHQDYAFKCTQHNCTLGLLQSVQIFVKSKHNFFNENLYFLDN